MTRAAIAQLSFKSALTTQKRTKSRIASHLEPILYGFDASKVAPLSDYSVYENMFSINVCGLLCVTYQSCTDVISLNVTDKQSNVFDSDKTMESAINECVL